MSKMRCACGHTIIDQTDDLPYKATFVRAYDEEDVFESLEREKEGEGADAVCSRFLQTWISHTGTMYECEMCGRLHVEDPKAPNFFHSFMPENKKVNQIFRSSRDDRS